MHIYLGLLFFLFFIYSDEKYSECYRIEGVSKSKENLRFVSVVIILSALSFFRKDIGVDYVAYVENLINISRGYNNYMEIGFKLFSKVVMKVSNDPRLVIGFAGVITQFFFIKAFFDQSKNQKMSIFLYLTWGYYFYTYNSIRYYLALSIVIYSAKYIAHKKYVVFIFLVLLATTFHKSALICIPLYILASLNLKRREYIGILVLFVLSWVFKNEVRRLIFMIYPSYEGSVYDDFGISWLNILRSFCVMIFSFFISEDEDRVIRVYRNLNVFAFLLYTFAYWIPETSRIGYYVNIGCIILVPNILHSINGDKKKYYEAVIYTLSILLFLVLMQGFYNYNIKLLPYEAWI